MTSPVAAFTRMGFPQVAAPLPESETGVASLRWGAAVLRFRTNPNEFNWQYTLQKRIDATYGGRVVQLLGTRIEEFSLKADAGGGGWDYLNKISTFARDIMINQRNGIPATFEYTTRGWRLNVFVASVPFDDAVEEVLREFEIQFKVQEDVSGVMSRNSLSAELAKLKDGVAFQRTKYNDPRLADGGTISDQEQSVAATTVGALQGALGGVLGYVNNPFLPGSAAPGSSPIVTPSGSGALPGIGGQ